ncbi:MAG: hypothetical protein MJ137_00395 [Clostridia bacterium]|nr:hypothetical protein [Clostridia bacterium]
MFVNGFDKKRDLFVILGTVAALATGFSGTRTVIGALSFIKNYGNTASTGSMLALSSYIASLVGTVSGILWVIFLFTAPFLRRANIFFVISRSISVIVILFSNISVQSVGVTVSPADRAENLLLLVLQLFIDAAFILAGAWNFRIKPLNITADVAVILSIAFTAMTTLTVAKAIIGKNIDIGSFAVSWVISAAELAVNAVFWFVAVGFRRKKAG